MTDGPDDPASNAAATWADLFARTADLAVTADDVRGALTRRREATDE